ncbi:vWA domain-containing protein [Fimbriiglobus ruber]|uniref:VWFA domain-containing protein n=1 Tax=Fimbriiglobus ruber TaxID=1908690 RepID=A0A225EGU5_9BACT|nr:vWA domain-containing protein [Fimbriiglobus ruber]OWK47427.1 hypothetical protein FRUB_01126 [Fimbriiglobus ruber]
MSRYFRTAVLFAVVAIIGSTPGLASAAPIPAEKPKNIDLVICLDVSNSMDGLIESAKLRLWDIVNELARAKPTPDLRVALYSYGHNNYPADKGWVRKELDLTTDLDEVYAKLTALRTNGGTEYVARVTRDAIAEQKWTDKANALKVIFVCGNEPADQDKEVHLYDVAAMAKKQGVLINTIYCGANANAEAAGWRNYATQAGGSYANIDQDRARRDPVAGIKSPHDERLLELNGKLNGTYVAFGDDGAAKGANQVLQDSAAAKASPSAALARAESKANGLYRNGSWDLIDRMRDDPKFDVTKLKDEELCEEMRKLKPEERLAYLKKKAEERVAIQKEINDLSGKRAKYVAEQVKKIPKSEGEKALDEAFKGIIRDQAQAKGFEFPAAEKK